MEELGQPITIGQNHKRLIAKQEADVSVTLTPTSTKTKFLIAN